MKEEIRHSIKVLSKLTGRKYQSHFIDDGWRTVNVNVKEILNNFWVHTAIYTDHCTNNYYSCMPLLNFELLIDGKSHQMSIARMQLW